MWIYVIIALLVIIIIYLLALFNNLIRLNNKVKEAFATMDVYLKKRWDLIPNIVEAVSGYTSHEKDTLVSIIQARSGSYDNMSQDDKLTTNEQITQSIGKIMVLAESYPELKSSNNFINLSNNLTMVENEIANARKYYNAVIRIYNNKIQTFPNNIFAKLFGYKTKSMFEATSEERESIKVEL